MTVSTY